MANTIIELQEQLEEWKQKALAANQIDELKKMLDAETEAKMNWKKQFDDIKFQFDQMQRDMEKKLKNNEEADKLRQQLESMQKNLSFAVHEKEL